MVTETSVWFSASDANWCGGSNRGVRCCHQSDPSTRHLLFSRPPLDPLTQLLRSFGTVGLGQNLVITSQQPVDTFITTPTPIGSDHGWFAFRFPLAESRFSRNDQRLEGTIQPGLALKEGMSHPFKTTREAITRPTWRPLWFFGLAKDPLLASSAFFPQGIPERALSTSCNRWSSS